MIDQELEELILLMEEAGETPEVIGEAIEEYNAKKAQDSQTSPNGESKTPGQEEEKSLSTTETTEEDTSLNVEVDPLEKYRKQQELLDKAGVGPAIDTSTMLENKDRLYAERPEWAERAGLIQANDGTGAYIRPEIAEKRLTESRSIIEKQQKDLIERKQVLENYAKGFEENEGLDTSGLLGQFDSANYDNQVEEYNKRFENYKKEVEKYQLALDSYNYETSRPKVEKEVGFFEGLGNIVKNVPTQLEGVLYGAEASTIEYLRFFGGDQIADVITGLEVNKIVLTDMDTGEKIPYYLNDGVRNPVYTRIMSDSNMRSKFPDDKGAMKKRYQYVYTEGENEGLPIGSVADAKITELLTSIDELEYLPTGRGIVGGVKEGSAKDVVLGAANAVTSVVTTAVPAALTGGASLVPQVAIPMWTEYNIELAKAKYPDDPDALAKLVENDEVEYAIPGALGTLCVGLESMGLKGISKAILSKGVRSNVLGRVVLAGNPEGLTEGLQGGVEVLNTSLAQGKSYEDAIDDVAEFFVSEQFVENYAQGFVGGSSVAGAGRQVRNALRDGNSNLKVNEFVNTLSDLQAKKLESNSPEVRQALDKKIQVVEQQFAQYIIEANDIANYLNKDQVSELLDILDSKDGFRSTISKLEKQKADGIISESDFDMARQDAVQELDKIDARVLEIKREANRKLLQKNLATSEQAISNIEGLSQQSFATTEEFLNEVNRRLEEKGKPSISDASNIDGLVFDNEILINEEVAAETNAVSVGSHELLHGIMKATLTGRNRVLGKDANGNNIETDLTEEGSQLIKSFLDGLSKKERDIIQKRIDDNYRYNEDGSERQFDEYAEEYLNAYADAAVKGEFDGNMLRKAGNFIAGLFKRKGYDNIKFESGKDVKDFLTSYAKDVKQGKVGEKFTDLAAEGIEIDAEKLKFSKSAQAEVNKLAENQTNKSWRKGGGDAAIKSLKDNGTFDALIASKYKVRPIPADFVDKVYSELTPYIKRFKPEQNDNLFAYINAQVANKAGTVYNREYKVEQRTQDIDAKTTEGAPTIQVAAETEADVKSFEEQDLSIPGRKKRAKQQELDQSSKFRRELGLDDKLVQKVKDTVVKTFGTKLPDVESKKFKAALQKAYRTELKKPIQDMIGKGETYDTFLAEQFPLVYKFLPKETLIQMERNVADENKIFTKKRRITKATEVDALIEQGLLPKNTNRLSGPNYIEKLPYPGRKKVLAYFRGANMENELGYKVGTSTLGTRKDKLAMEIGVELGLDATMETLKDPAVQERRQGILELQGVDQKKNETAIIGKQIDRDPNIKFSKTSKYVAGLAPNKLLKILNVPNPVAFKKVPYIGAKGKEKFHRLVDFSRLVEVKKATLELGAYTTEVLTTFNDFTGGKYLNDIRTTMSGGQGISFFGLTSTFDSLTKGLQPGPKLFPRTNYAKGKKLDSNAVRKEGGKIVFGKGKDQLSEKEFVAKEFKKLDNLENFFTDLQAYLKEHPEHAWFWARMITDASSNQYSMPRVSAPVIGFPIDSNGKFIYDEIIVEEHSFPQNNVGALLLHAAITGGSIKDVMKIIRGSYAQLALLNSEKHPHDTMVNVNYKTTMPDVFWDKIVPRLIDGSLKITNGLASMVRYSESGVNLNMYMVPGTNQTITEYFGVGKYDNASQALIDKQNELITKFLTGEITKKEATGLIKEFAKVEQVLQNSKDNNTSVYDKALETKVKYSKTGKAKGMSVFDFDETLIIDGENFIIATDPVTGQQVEIKSNEWPIKGPDLAAAGFEFDFSDFAQVRGGKEGPLLQKMKNQISKYGPENVFVLTARQQDSAQPIHQWLKSQGVDIPIKNITGLGKSEGSAKADWMLQKFAEGYNDMYFVDDALPNVKAVKDVLDRLDIKSKVVQAKIKFSKSGPKKMSNILDEGELDLNKILEQTKGVKAEKRFSSVKARKRGKNKGKFKFFIPPSADDFAGLMYHFMGKGEQGNKHHAWFKENLFDPFSKGIRHLNSVKQAVANDMKSLRRAMPSVRKKLTKTIPGTEYTYEDAVRVYNWNSAGIEIPGLSSADLNTLVKTVEGDVELLAFAQTFGGVSGQSAAGIVEPGDHWEAGTIASDLNDSLEQARKTYLSEWIENKNVIFDEANMNKIEAVYGSNFREALEDLLYRMENGGNRSRGAGRLVNNFMNWIHGSIGTTMFFNARSAMLQMISNVNFINWSDNNILKAAGSFANQPQYWKDVAMIFNSPFLKQRRAGLQTDVNAAELLAEIKGSKNKMKAATAYLLQLGFTPTQIADSFAIATGGATFYRNRVKTYTTEGMSQQDAETKAFEDMMEIAEETQQSAREDRISQQQASPLGKMILAFQNTPMQYNRLIKKAAMDLVNGRGDIKANISKIVYYGAIQNMIFYGLQQALFAALFGGDEEDELTDKKKERVINGMMDTLLRGAGIGGAVVSTIKNVLLKIMDEKEKADDGLFYTDPDWNNVTVEALNLSPPIGIKARKISSSLKTWEYNNEVIKYMDKTDIDNPIYDAVTSGTEAVTNLPLNRLYNKYQNLKEATNSDHEMWQRIAMGLGWSRWNFGLQNQDVMTAKNKIKEIKAEEKEQRKEQKKKERAAEKAAEEKAIEQGFLEDQKKEKEEGAEEVRCAAVNRAGKRCSNIALPGEKYCTIHMPVPQQEKEVQCSHIKKDGKRCKMKTKNKSGKCYYHD